MHAHSSITVVQVRQGNHDLYSWIHFICGIFMHNVDKLAIFSYVHHLYRFFDIYGTHLVNDAELGGKMIHQVISNVDAQ